MTSPRPGTHETRARILRAASEIAVSGDGSVVSVRAVAERAGVGIGTLRYHFPTQRELHDAVLSSIYEQAMPDDRIHDTSLPARDRLVECLRGILAPVGVDRQAREVWTELFHAYVDVAAPPRQRDGYLELSRQAARRVESWLAVLCEEGALASGDNTARARFLLAVVNGLAIQRALPSDLPALEVESAVLGATVDAVLGQAATG